MEQPLLLPAKAYNRLGLAFLTFLGGLVIGTIPLSYAAYYLYPAFVEKGYAIVVNYTAMYLIGFPLYLLVLRTVPSHPPQRTAQPKTLSIASILGLYAVSYAIVGVLGAFSNYLNDWIGSLLNNGYSAETVTDLSGQNMLMLFISGVIVAPIMEEVVFRGIPYKKLAGYGEQAFLLFTSLVFGLFHLNLGQFFYATALGLLFAKITWETGTVRYSVLLHVMVNLTGGVGIGSLVMRFGKGNASNFYGYAVLALMAVGVVVSAVWLLRGRGFLRSLLPRRMPKSDLRRALLAPGCVLYYAVCVLLIASAIFSSTFL